MYFLKDLSAPLPARFPESLFCRRKIFFRTQFEFPLWRGNKFCNTLKPTRELKLLHEKLFGRRKVGEVGQVPDPLFTLLDTRLLHRTVHATNIEDKTLQNFNGDVHCTCTCTLWKNKLAELRRSFLKKLQFGKSKCESSWS